jgi:hypothetical protein
MAGFATVHVEQGRPATEPVDEFLVKVQREGGRVLCVYPLVASPPLDLGVDVGDRFFWEIVHVVYEDGREPRGE